MGTALGLIGSLSLIIAAYFGLASQWSPYPDPAAADIAWRLVQLAATAFVGYMVLRGIEWRSTQRDRAAELAQSTTPGPP